MKWDDHKKRWVKDKWELWFAWKPVYKLTGERVWLRWLSRKPAENPGGNYTFLGVKCGDGVWEYAHRSFAIDEKDKLK